MTAKDKCLNKPNMTRDLWEMILGEHGQISAVDCDG